jgi:hypothetical protein
MVWPLDLLRRNGKPLKLNQLRAMMSGDLIVSAFENLVFTFSKVNPQADGKTGYREKQDIVIYETNI